MDTRLETHHAVLELNQRLLHNCLEGVEDSACWPASGQGMGFVASHLVAARGFLLRLLGGAPRHPMLERLDAASQVEDLDPRPELADLLELWDMLSGQLYQRLRTLPDEQLSRSIEQRFPLSDTTLLGGLAFLSHHESYHVGQLGLLRRQLGHPPISYGEPGGERD